MNPAPTLHITKKQSKLYNTFLYANLFSSDSIGNNTIDSTNKTNMSNNNNNHNKLTPIPPRHPSNNIKYAKPIFSPTTPSMQKIFSSITSSHHKISELSQNKLQQNISTIIPIITTPPTK